MAGDLSTIIAAIEVRLAVLGFTKSKTVFDFDSVPDSIIDSAYRIDSRQLENEYIMGNNALTADELSIFIAYKMTRDGSVVLSKALDDRETIEKDIIENVSITTCPTQKPILALSGEASAAKYLTNYLVSKLAFRCDYIRDLTPTT